MANAYIETTNKERTIQVPERRLILDLSMSEAHLIERLLRWTPAKIARESGVECTEQAWWEVNTALGHPNDLSSGAILMTTVGLQEMTK